MNDSVRAVLDVIARVRPTWRAVRNASEAVALPPHTLLHAGPPFRDPRRPSAPVLSSAVLCCVYEGWATDVEHAEQLIRSGDVVLSSAQGYGVVTPLAAVMSPRTALVEVADAGCAGLDSTPSWSLLGSGAGPQIRFGSRDVRIIERMRWRDEVLAPVLASVVRRTPIDLLDIAKTALADGDDLHARTTSATAALRDRLAPLLDGAHAGAVDAMLRGTPLFFLTLWMAACHRMLSDLQRVREAKTHVVAFAGNGAEVGIRLAGAPGQWFTASAMPPTGPRIVPENHVLAAGLTGDSGVIDAAGFGAAALASAPEPAGALESFLPSNWRDEQPRLFDRQSPCVAVLDAARVARDKTGPLAAIAMIGADGEAGLLGRGIYAAPVELFERAVDAIDPSSNRT